MNPYAYYARDLADAAFGPARAALDTIASLFTSPWNPLAPSVFAGSVAASAELFERLTRRYDKPRFGLDCIVAGEKSIPIEQRAVFQRPFCRVLHFARPPEPAPLPKLLIIAPMAGHHATLAREAIEAFLPTHDVFVTDWVDARLVPPAAGHFDVNDYVDYLIAIFRTLGPGVHALGICQASLPLIVATARMEAENEASSPRSVTLMAGPIDTRRNRTVVNRFAERRGTDWFRRHCLVTIPPPHPGTGRVVYPGFLQLCGFLSLNPHRHLQAHVQMFQLLMAGEASSAQRYRRFYDEYFAVMDLTGEFYIQTVDAVFVRHALPRGEFTYRGNRIELSAIRRAGLMTVEGGKDDITGVGQTYAAHELCPNVPAEMRAHHLQDDVGHYGLFNGLQFRHSIAPRIARFICEVDAHAARTRR
jgi:poly(3-hydroxybutyrate) depolymerase